MVMKRLIALIALAGCTTAASPLPTPDQDTCNAATYRDRVGQPATVLEHVLLLGKVRVIRPGDAVTMDYQADRINFMIDGTGTISAINCG